MTISSFFLQTFIESLTRYIYWENPASQNDFFGFLSHKDQILSITWKKSSWIGVKWLFASIGVIEIAYSDFCIFQIYSQDKERR